MKMIDFNNWAPRNKSNIPIPVTDLPVLTISSLYHNFYFYNSRGLAIFYYRLSVILLN